MSRNIFIAALLCLSFHSMAYSQTYYHATMADAISKQYNGQSYGSNTYLYYLDIYMTVPAKPNVDPLRTVKYYLCFYLYASSPGSGSFYISQGLDVVQQHPGGYLVSGVSFPYYEPMGTGNDRVEGSYPDATVAMYTGYMNTKPPAPNLSYPTSVNVNRNFYTKSDVESYYANFNAAVANVPSTIYYNGQNREVSSKPSPLNPDDLTRDYDGGGISDLDEVFRNPYPGSSVTSWRDDHDCICESCCTCTCICGYVGWPNRTTCRGGRNDCDCHKTCVCYACCECRCTCDGVWKKHCDGTDHVETGCMCHHCHCGACCECECTCGEWHGRSCDGTDNSETGCSCHACSCGACCNCHCVCGYSWPHSCWGNSDPEGGCSCHACTCGAGCWHCCTCGKFWPTTCQSRPEDCSCHEVCICGACCQCKCICGKWKGRSCDSTANSETGCSCHAVCICGVCCSCNCICGNWKGKICDGTTNSETGCSCHLIVCECGACCSCRCLCGKWSDKICDGRPSSCSCHTTNDNGCECSACCSCRCVCGKWLAKICDGKPKSCVCHAICGACCSCRCVASHVHVPRCNGQPGSCFCHNIDDCSCNACCRCKCICGKWRGQMCSGNAFDPAKPDTTCHCHDQVAGNDWFPRSELEQSFNFFMQKLQAKFGIDLLLMFEDIQASQFASTTLVIPRFVPGMQPQYITFNVHDLASNYSETVQSLRFLFYAFMFLYAIRIVLVTLRQY